MINKKAVTDILFITQIIMGCVLCGSQYFRLIENTEGQLLSMIAIMEVFFALHLILAMNSHHAKPSRVTAQSVWLYGILIILLGSNVLAFYINGNYLWSSNDTNTVILAVCGTIVIGNIMLFYKIGINNPMPKAWLAMLLKAGPQFIMAYEIALKGGAGVPLIVLIAGHLSILLRITQVGFTIHEGGWEHNRTWLFISETTCEISWIAVSVVWVFWYLS